jgi:glucosaminylphosphatidylinositol acyltransferase
MNQKQANLPYILWVSAFNTSFLLGYLLLDLIFFPSPLSKSVYSKTSKLKVPVANTHSAGSGVMHPQQQQQQQPGNPPALLEAINKNGLAMFLLVCRFLSLITLVLTWMNL